MKDWILMILSVMIFSLSSIEIVEYGMILPKFCSFGILLSLEEARESSYFLSADGLLTMVFEFKVKPFEDERLVVLVTDVGGVFRSSYYWSYFLFSSFFTKSSMRLYKVTAGAPRVLTTGPRGGLFIPPVGGLSTGLDKSSSIACECVFLASFLILASYLNFSWAVCPVTSKSLLGLSQPLVIFSSF